MKYSRRLFDRRCAALVAAVLCLSACDVSFDGDVDRDDDSSWTFPVTRPNGERVALVKKEWSGLLTEAFTDADRFRLTYESQRLSADERALLLAATIFIDLTWFEQNAND